MAGSIGVVALLAGFLWLQRPWRAIALARSGGAEARAAAADSAILFALATGVMIATYTAIDRLGTRQIDVLTYAAILWMTCSVVLVALGLASSPAATCCATGRRRRAGRRSAGS